MQPVSPAGDWRGTRRLGGAAGTSPVLGVNFWAWPGLCNRDYEDSAALRNGTQLGFVVRFCWGALSFASRLFVVVVVVIITVYMCSCVYIITLHHSSVCSLVVLVVYTVFLLFSPSLVSLPPCCHWSKGAQSFSRMDGGRTLLNTTMSVWHTYKHTHTQTHTRTYKHTQKVNKVPLPSPTVLAPPLGVLFPIAPSFFFMLLASFKFKFNVCACMCGGSHGTRRSR